jgi:hypothetical protein
MRLATATLRGFFTTTGVLQGITAVAVGALLALAPLAVQAQPTVDGDLSEDAYTWVVNEQDETGFGDTNDIDSLGYAIQNNTLYVAQAGTLEADNTNGFALFGNVTGDGAPTGTPAGDSLGIDNPNQDFHFLDGEAGANTGFSADFEVDFASAIGPFDAEAPFDTTGAFVANYTGDSPTVLDLGRTDQSGTSETSGGITFAYLNSEDPDTGAEWAIPFDAIAATASNDIEVSTVIVSSTGYFSNEIIPGDGTAIADSETDGGGNPGFDAMWEQYAGGPWHTGSIPLPVEFASFDAKRSDGGAILSWTTASETNNAGFAVEHAVGPEGAFQQVGWVEGVGTTTEAQSYRYAVEDLSAGTHRFRLKQEDLDGSASLSKVVEVDVRPDGPIAIEQVAPNPVTQTSTLRFTPRESGAVTVGLYDVLGRRVKTLHEGRVSGGQSQQVTLDASALSSGVYFLRVKGEGFSKTRRITVTQ